MQGRKKQLMMMVLANKKECTENWEEEQLARNKQAASKEKEKFTMIKLQNGITE